MQILSVTSPAFLKYGRVIRHVEFGDLIREMKNTPIPQGVVYEPSVSQLEELSLMQEVSAVLYGEMPIQIGYCNGHNELLNGLEYHRSSEINVAATDAILMLGMQSDMEEDFTYDTSKVEAFLVPKGTAVELYATTLHYAPCGVEGAGFQVAVILPRGTNYPLQKKHGKVLSQGTAPNEDALLTAVNKWLIGHPEGGMEEGTFLGLKGKNRSILE